jgi:hypothetical protein
MSPQRFPVRVGAVRPSQLMFSHGIGSLLDLPNFCAVVGGLDDWDGTYQDNVKEERLLAAVRALKGLAQVDDLRTPPWMAETRNPFDDWAHVGVPIVAFPRWLRCTACNLTMPVETGLFEFRSEPFRPDRTRFTHGCRTSGRPPLAVPARFVTACPDGHLDEFPWIDFCHHKRACTGVPQIRLNEIGGGSRSTDLEAECITCGQRMHVSQAFGEPGAKTMPRCRGRHPHLRMFDPRGCTHQLRAVLLGASNAWFAITRSVLSLPVSTNVVEQLVAQHWADLKDVTTREMLPVVLRLAQQLRPLLGRDVDQVWAAMEQRRTTAPTPGPEALDLLAPEWALFASPDTAPSSEDFNLRAVSAPPAYTSVIGQIVLADRLRVVTAMCGFTRIDAPDSGVAEDLETFESAPLSRQAPRWVPAAEARGEGIFIQLKEQAVVEWVSRVSDSPRLAGLDRSHRRWRARRNLEPRPSPGPRYVLLHSLAHALVQELALECGYSPASLQERIYAREPDDRGGPMAGLLIYTAASDSEGTLGGLVSLGEPQRLGRLLAQALERARLCSADPLCAEHVPDAGEDSLHNASCHACLFVPETTCERGNRYLDRATLVETLDGAGVHYFT